jgi:hypothetical protein
MAAILEARTAQDSDTPATPVFASPIRHPSAWTVADFRSPADYSVDLDAAQLRDIAAAVRRIKAAGIGLDGLQREHFEVPSLRPVVEEIRRQVEDGRGFVLLRRLPIEDYSKDDLGLIFWGIGTHLGRGLSQSVMGDRLGHVKDFSREDPGARAYRNKQELSPHTDSCDLVGLLCLRNALAGGGVSRLTSAISVHNALLAEHPGRARGALPRLCPPPARRGAAGRTALHALSHPGLFECRRQGVGALCALLHRGR